MYGVTCSGGKLFDSEEDAQTWVLNRLTFMIETDLEPDRRTLKKLIKISNAIESKKLTLAIDLANKALRFGSGYHVYKTVSLPKEKKLYIGRIKKLKNTISAKLLLET